MTDSEYLPAHHTSPEEVQHLDALLSQCGKRVTGRELARSGRSYRVVNRTLLMKEMLRLVEVFVEDRLRQAESHLSGILRRREAEACEDGRMRVLVSLAELGDLVDSVIESLQGEAGPTAAKALDKRLDRVFRSYGYERIVTVGSVFDPTIHEALDEEPEEGVPPGIIVRELGRGYRKESFVLRVARVVVSS